MSDFIELEESSDAIALEEGGGAILAEEDAGVLVNDLAGNPIRIESATASLIRGPLFIRSIQWVDSASDIADDDDLVFKLDGATITVKPQMDLSGPVNGIAYKSREFIVSDRFEVTTLDHGQLLIWKR